MLDSELDEVAEWFDSNKLTLNVNKNTQGDVISRNEAIQRVTEAKFLGVIVDQHLNWKEHICKWNHKKNLNHVAKYHTFGIL